MTKIAYQFRNAILCDDVRNEVGNKKSLMGVLSGDVIVGEMPAQIFLAAYVEYIRDVANSESNIKIRLLQDDTEIATISITTHKSTSKPAISSLVLPRALVVFERDCVFKIVASVDGDQETEILSKKVYKGLISTTASVLPASQSPSAP